MRPTGDNHIRLVIQGVRGSHAEPATYRVIAYPHRPCMKDEPATFSSLDDLLARLREVVPGVDEHIFSAAEAGTQILFARELELTDEQPKTLRLAR
jgi:hypothetical protein